MAISTHMATVTLMLMAMVTLTLVATATLTVLRVHQNPRRGSTAAWL